MGSSKSYTMGLGKMKSGGAMSGGQVPALGPGPGKAAMRVRGNAAPDNMDKIPSGKPPKGMKIQREGE